MDPTSSIALRSVMEPSLDAVFPTPSPGSVRGLASSDLGAGWAQRSSSIKSRSFEHLGGVARRAVYEGSPRRKRDIVNKPLGVFGERPFKGCASRTANRPLCWRVDRGALWAKTSASRLLREVGDLNRSRPRANARRAAKSRLIGDLAVFRSCAGARNCRASPA